MNPNLPDLEASSPSILVTGASGFIGQRVVSTLIEQGHRVRVLIRPDKEFDSRMPRGCEQLAVDITDVDRLSVIVAESSTVLYCAGSVRGRKPEDFEIANIKGIHAMLCAMETVANAPPMLLLSSLAASRPHLSDYARSKYEGEQLLHAKSVLPWTIFRPPAVYGPGDRELLPLLKMVRRGLLAVAGPPGQRLSLLHVDDLANAVIFWLSATPECLHKTYSIDDGKTGGYSWDEIGEAVNDGNYRTLHLPGFLLNMTARINLLMSSLFAYMPMLTPGKARELLEPDWLCDNREFSNTSGWQPQLDLQWGVQQLFNKNSKP